MDLERLQNMDFMFTALPALFAEIALVIMATGVRDLVRGGVLASQGIPTSGVVLENFVRRYGHEDSRRPTGSMSMAMRGGFG